MNLQRREEIRVIAECPNDRHWAQEMRRAVAELLAHIDTLEQTAAERVIADGSRGPTPDYTGEGSAWVPPVESHSIGTADSVYFRRELESLVQRLPSADGPWLARYLLKLARVADSATVDCAPVEARAVVAPDFSDAKAGVLAWENGYDDGDHLARDLVKAAWAYARSNSSTIPALRANQGEANHV